MTHVPGWWAFLLLALAAYRLTRLVGWDDLPPIVRVRCWLIGANWKEGEGEWKFNRPLLAHFIHCPFCVGWWLSLGFYVFWLVAHTAALVVASPLAISALVGLVAKNLDS